VGGDPVILEIAYLRLGLGHGRVVLADPSLGGLHAGLEVGDVLLYLAEARLERGELALLLVLAVVEGLELLPDSLRAQLGLVDLSLRLRDAVREELSLLLLADLLDREAVDRLLVLGELGLHAVDDIEPLLEREVDGVDLGLELVALLGLGRDLLVPAVPILDKLPEAEEMEVELGGEDLVLERAVLQRLVRLELEGVVAPLHLAEDARDLAHVLLGLLELELGLPGAHLVLRDARRLLEEVAALLGLGGEDLVDLALLHHGVGRLADARVPEELAYLLELGGLPVDEVLALAGAVEPPLDGDLGHVQREEAVLVRDRDRDLGDGEGLPRLGPVEDDVLHAVGTEALGGLLAHHPLYGVDDIGLPAAVGAEKGGYAV